MRMEGSWKLKIRVLLVYAIFDVKINEPGNESPAGDHPLDEG